MGHEGGSLHVDVETELLFDLTLQLGKIVPKENSDDPEADAAHASLRLQGSRNGMGSQALRGKTPSIPGSEPG
jgi:hypothetical protein